MNHKIANSSFYSRKRVVFHIFIPNLILVMSYFQTHETVTCLRGKILQQTILFFFFYQGVSFSSKWQIPRTNPYEGVVGHACVLTEVPPSKDIL